MDTVNARILARRDTTANWNTHRDFIPMRGEVIIYTDHGTVEDDQGHTINVPGVKIGDGSSYLIDLPFSGDDVRYQILTEIREHSGNTEIHVTAAEKTFWNNKLNCVTDNETLIINRN